jgi:hypothetical protein
MIRANGKLIQLKSIPTKKDKNRVFQTVRVLGENGEVHNFMYFPKDNKDGKQDLLTCNVGQDVDIVLNEDTNAVIQNLSLLGKK